MEGLDDPMDTVQSFHGRSHGCPELDADTVYQVLIRLVDVGSAHNLVACSGACRLWYSGALNDELWSRLLLRKLGPAASSDSRNRYGMKCKSQYVRAVTTRVRVWGQMGVRGKVDELGCIRSLIGVRTVSAGAGFSCAVTWDGRAFCWGNNASGQCGFAGTVFVDVPTVVQLPASCSAVVDIACGLEHVGCICVRSDSSGTALLCWGSNSAGQLGECGICEADSICSVVQAGGVQMVIQKSEAGFSRLACGSHHSVAIANGTVFAWGQSCHGQCGHGDSVNADARRSRAVEGLEGVEAVEVAAGANFTLAVTPCGVLTFGANTYGQLGRETSDTCDPTPTPVDVEGATSTSVCGVVCGDDHSLLRLSDGSVFVWGRGSLAALGLGAQAPSRCTRPTILPSISCLTPESVLQENAPADVYLAAGGDNSGLLHLQGQGGFGARGLSNSLFTWGSNKWGELVHRKRPLVKPKLVKVCTDESSELFAFCLGHSHAIALVEWKSAADRDKLPRLYQELGGGGGEPVPLRWAAGGAECAVKSQNETSALEAKSYQRAEDDVRRRQKKCNSMADQGRETPSAGVEGGASQVCTKRGLRARLQAFCVSKETELNISCWTSAERWRVHKAAESLGLHHQTLGGPVHSAGSESGRYIRITKVGDLCCQQSTSLAREGDCVDGAEADGNVGGAAAVSLGDPCLPRVAPDRRWKSHCRRAKPREWSGAGHESDENDQ